MNMSITKKVRKRVYVSRLYPPFSPHLDLKLDARPAEAASSRGSRSKVIESLDFNHLLLLLVCLWCTNFPEGFAESHTIVHYFRDSNGSSHKNEKQEYRKC